jgi:hypothetical protein
MNFRMNKTLRFWVDVEYEKRKWEAGNRNKHRLIAEILQEFEQRGDAIPECQQENRLEAESVDAHAPCRRRTRRGRRPGGFPLMAEATLLNSNPSYSLFLSRQCTHHPILRLA